MKTLIFFSVLMISNIGLSQPESKFMIHNEIERQYFIYVPVKQNSDKLPVVFNFHGYGSNAYNQMYYSKLNELAEKENFIAIHPEGLILNGKTHWNVGGWTINSTIDDVDFIDKLIDILKKNYNVDMNRIYAMGMSNGGFFSFKLACELSERIAAIGSVTGSMTPEIINNCNIKRAVPIIQLHGTTDKVVPYAGAGNWTLGIDNVIEFWKEKNNTNTSAYVTEINDSVKSDGSKVILYEFQRGENNSEVIHYKIINGGHHWFGVQGNMDINSTNVIWGFLKKFTLNGKVD